MRKLTTAATAGAVLIGIGAFAGLGLAEPGGTGSERAVAAPVVAAPVTGVAAAGGAARGRPTRTDDRLLLRGQRHRAAGRGRRRRPADPMPARRRQPDRGGARTAEGVVIAYLSRANPENGNTPPRTYYVGIEDVDSGNPAGSGALVEVQCGKGMRVELTGGRQR